MQAFLLAAGLGTRLRPLTDTMPKALVPIAGKPLLQWQLEKLQAAGIRDVVINIHHLGQQIIDYCATHTPEGMRIRFSDERQQLLETGGGLRHAAPLFESASDPILVLNVDILSTIDLQALIADWKEDYLASIVVSPRETRRYFCFDSEDYLCGWTNRATEAVKGTYTDRQLAFSGMHLVHPRIFGLMQTYPEKFSITDFYLDCCATERIKAYIPADYRMMDIGKIDHLQEAEAFAHTL